MKTAVVAAVMYWISLKYTSGEKAKFVSMTLDRTALYCQGAAWWEVIG